MENLSNFLLKLSRSLFADTAKIVAPPGYIAYITCTYSSAENQQVSEWLLSTFPEFQPVTVPDREKYRSHF